MLRNKAVSFIRRRAPAEDPFFLSVAFLAPHHESAYVQRRTGQVVRPAPRHRTAFAHARLPRVAGYNEPNVSDKPWFLSRWHGPLTPREHVAILARSRQRRASLLAVDEAVAKIVAEVRRAGELDNTLVLFTSDNGFMQGEHRVPQGKMLPYDPSTHVPLLVRGPRIPAGRRSRELVSNIDIAPTVLDLTPATSRMRLDGRSLLPFARNPRLRSARPLLHETGGNGIWGRRRQEGAKGQQPRVPAWRAIRTNRWLYVSYKGGQQELYDARRDRAQLRSVARDPRYRVRLRTLRRILGDLAQCSGRACRRFADPSVR